MDRSKEEVFSTILTIFLALYAALLGPELPKSIKNLFNNTIFRIIVLFLVVYKGNKDPRLSIMIAIAFVLTLDYLHVMDTKEAFGRGKQSRQIELVEDGEPCPLKYESQKMCKSGCCNFGTCGACSRRRRS